MQILSPPNKKDPEGSLGLNHRHNRDLDLIEKVSLENLRQISVSITTNTETHFHFCNKRVEPPFMFGCDLEKFSIV